MTDFRFTVPLGEHLDGLVDRFNAKSGKSWFDFFGGLVDADFGFGFNKTRPPVEFRRHVNDGDARDFVAVKEAPIDRRGSAIFRQ